MGIHHRGDRRIGRLGWKLSSCWLAAKPRCYSDIGTVKQGLGLKGWPVRLPEEPIENSEEPKLLIQRVKGG